MLRYVSWHYTMVSNNYAVRVHETKITKYHTIQYNGKFALKN